MSLEENYIEYTGQLSLAVLGVSASYFINPSQPLTLLGLLFIPLLYGYTAYISRDGFHRASLATVPASIFAMVGGLTALVVVPYTLGNIMVSAFSGGTRFKDFYGSTSLPLLLTGLVVGLALFGYGTYDQQFRQDSVSLAGDKVAELAQSTVQEAGMIEGQKDSQLRLVNSTSRATARLMVQNIYNNSQPSPEVMDAIGNASRDVPVQVYNMTASRFEENNVDLSGQVEDMFVDTFSGSKFILIIPAVAGFIYSLQPLIGILTGIFAKIFFVAGGRTET